MRGRIRSVSGHEVEKLASRWEMCAVPPKSIDGPAALSLQAGPWAPATSGQTAAAALRAKGEWSLEGPPRNFDEPEWWYRTRFARPVEGDETVLRFDGLATVADVWLNGSPLFTSNSMFVAHEEAIGGASGPALSDENELAIRFRSLESELKTKRPRPRYKTPMVSNQQLRYQRTTLLGRTPGWSPPAAAVGPWREVWLERRHKVAVSDISLSPLLQGNEAWLTITCTVRALGTFQVGSVVVVLRRGESVHVATLDRISETQFRGSVHVPDVARWWPHTHGEPALYDARIVVGEAGALGALDALQVELGPVGFREVSFRKSALYINGVKVFCRGACWTPLDPVTLDAPKAAYEVALRQAATAGMNMVRVGGTMTYEADAFYDEADKQGVMLWHDFMFANMDYPGDDPAFAALVDLESKQFLSRMQGRPSLAVLCGNSEVGQQAAMWGASRELWSPPLFNEVLPRLCREVIADVPYWPGSTHGGAFPHDPSEGTCSYYGVGAYLRDADDLRRSEVRFATECLAFANVPPPDAIPGGPSTRVHHPAWKSRTPRDLGAGWDFDDIRDFYVGEVFGVDVMKLRYEDHERYLTLGRTVTGELMAEAMGDFRRGESKCGGALVWFLRDLWPSAGWGVIDSRGVPKAAYFQLKRAQQPLAIYLSDEGLTGPAVNIANDAGRECEGKLTVSWFRDDGSLIASVEQPLTVKAHGTARIAVASMGDHWTDLTHAYRFGPRIVDVITATYDTGTSRREAFFFPAGVRAPLVSDIGLTAASTLRQDGGIEVVFTSRLLADTVALELENFTPEDNYFHVAPGGSKRVVLTRSSAGPLRGTAQPRNARATTKVPPPADTP